MKKMFFYVSLALLILVLAAPIGILPMLAVRANTSTSGLDASNQNNTVYIAIVIDDFGSLDRNGVDEMLALDIPLTCAVIPGLDNTVSDAQRAHENGHEVIVHMPMEAQITLPRDWYGPIMIKNSDSPETAVRITEESLAKTPHAVGMNIHIGTGVSRNTDILSAIMKYLMTKNLYFLDSKTIEDTRCGISAASVGFPLMTRDVFLETHTNHSYNFAIGELERARGIAKQKGYAIVIGHVGPEGGHNTAKAIRDKAKEFKNDNIEFVKLSHIFELVKKPV